MRKESNKAVWIGSVVLGLALVASPFIISHAQKEVEVSKVQPQSEKSDEKGSARSEVAKSVAGSLVLDTIAAQDPEWMLDRAGFVSRGDNNPFNYVDMLLKKGGTSVSVSISEHDSTEEAERRFSGSRSHGKSIPFNSFGDKGDKIVGQNGNLMALRFRKNNVFVRITTNDHKAAEQMAEYVSRSLQGASLK